MNAAGELRIPNCFFSEGETLGRGILALLDALGTNVERRLLLVGISPIRAFSYYRRSTTGAGSVGSAVNP
jgi:hypothetical protein